jgi:exopolyphosphatase/pppGpp-phosphohydrolase
VAPARAETLLGGVLILSEIQRRLGLTLRLGSGGVREGAAAELLLLDRLAA